MNAGASNDVVEPRPLLIFPCNGNGIEALDCLGSAFRCIGFIDDAASARARSPGGVCVSDRRALQLRPDAAVLAVPGGPTTFRGRRALIASLGVDERRFPRVVHPSAQVSAFATLGRNVLLMAGVVITSNAAIGDDVVVLPNSVIHHDAIVGAGTLVGANVTIAGGVVIGEQCYIASGACLRNGLRIGSGALVGMGSVVIRDVPERAVVAGSPARELSRRS